MSYFVLYLLSISLRYEQYAAYGFYTSAIGIVYVFISFGFKDAVVKLVSLNSKDELYNLSSSLRLWLYISFVLVLFLFAIDTTFGIACVSVILVHVLYIHSAVSRGKGNYLTDALLLPLYRFFWLLVISLIWLSIELSVNLVFIASILSAVLTLSLLGQPLAWKLLRSKINGISFPFMSPMLRSFFLVEIGAIIYQKSDILILQLMGVVDQEVATYFFSVQIYEAVISLVAPIGFIFFNLWNKSIDKKEFLLRISIACVSAIAVVGVLTWNYLGEFLVGHIFPRFYSAYELITILFIGILPMATSLLLAHVLIAQNAEKKYAVACAIVLLFSVTSNLIFIPSWGVYGASLTRLVSDVLLMLVLYFMFSKLKQNHSVAL